MKKEPESALNVQAGVSAPPSINRNIRRHRKASQDPKELAEKVIQRDRLALGRAITLVESNRRQDYEAAQQVIDACVAASGQSLRVGITGVPGVGKSTFIEAFGQHLIQEGNRVAVLAVDPSSSVTGGSILGDKSRMPELSRNDNAFVRPSPSSGSLGGVTRKTREAILLCEAAGFNVVLVETVGVGQSESAVKAMVDCFLLLMLAGAGDELQGIKRGIMEMADLLAITKVDGENKTAAVRAQRNYENALHLFPPAPSGWSPKVLLSSAKTRDGIDEVWDAVREYEAFMKQKSLFEQNRREQSKQWLKDAIGDGLFRAFNGDADVKREYPQIEARVFAGEITPQKGARELLGKHFQDED